MLKPEWAQAFFVKLRAYYLLTHSESDVEAWEELAKKTCQAIPIQLVSRLVEDAEETHKTE